MKKYYDTFYGEKISQYGLENGYIDYHTLNKIINPVLNNGIYDFINNMGYSWDMVSGINYDRIDELNELNDAADDYIYSLERAADKIDDCNREALESEIDRIYDEINERNDEINDIENMEGIEIYQYFIINECDVDLLKEAHEIVFYNSDADIYLWGVTHWGTSWDYVLTDIPCEEMEV